MDNNKPRPKIKSCSICDPFVLIIREDDTIGLFIGEIEKGKIRRKDMSPMGDKVRRSASPQASLAHEYPQTSRYIAGCFYTDTSGLFQTFLNEQAPAENVTSTLQGAMNACSWAGMIEGDEPASIPAKRVPDVAHELRFVDGNCFEGLQGDASEGNNVVGLDDFDGCAQVCRAVV